MERSQEIKVLRLARVEGRLDPIFRYLSEQIGLTERPIAPEGPEWPYKRAWNDGNTAAFLKVYKWLENITLPSPDAAENTED